MPIGIPKLPAPPASKMTARWSPFVEGDARCIISLTTTNLTQPVKDGLQLLADYRQKQVEKGPRPEVDEYRDFLGRTREWLTSHRVPSPLVAVLGQCLSQGTNQKTPSVHYRIGRVVQAFDQGCLEQVLKELGIERKPFRPRT